MIGKALKGRDYRNPNLRGIPCVIIDTPLVGLCFTFWELFGIVIYTLLQRYNKFLNHREGVGNLVLYLL